MEKIILFYIPPDSNSWELFMEKAFKNEFECTREDYKPILEKRQGELYDLPGFISAFNAEIISDQGLIFLVKHE